MVGYFSGHFYFSSPSRPLSAYLLIAAAGGVVCSCEACLVSQPSGEPVVQPARHTLPVSSVVSSTCLGWFGLSPLIRK